MTWFDYFWFAMGLLGLLLGGRNILKKGRNVDSESLRCAIVGAALTIVYICLYLKDSS